MKSGLGLYSKMNWDRNHNSDPIEISSPNQALRFLVQVEIKDLV
jgi:hypothetical protein